MTDTPIEVGSQEPASLKLRLDNVTKRFGNYTAVREVSLSVAVGQFMAIVGPSGCGKSTLLRMVAGLTPASQGNVTIDAQPVTGVRKGVGFLFQQDALLPWRTVLQNVMLGLRFAQVPEAEAEDRAATWIRKVGLHGFEKRYPAQLSGGMRKRTAIAQTLVTDPEILLMDEPFTGLDAQARYLIAQDLLNLAADGKRSIMFVTHDLDEAVGLADVIAVMTAGPAGTIKVVENVDLPRPRDLLALRSHPRYGQLTRALWEHLHEEVTRAYGRPS